MSSDFEDRDDLFDYEEDDPPIIITSDESLLQPKNRVTNNIDLKMFLDNLY